MLFTEDYVCICLSRASPQLDASTRAYPNLLVYTNFYHSLWQKPVIKFGVTILQLQLSLAIIYIYTVFQQG